MSFTEHDVHECRRLMRACRLNQLAIGDMLRAAWADGDALGQFCERVGLSVTTAKQWRATAKAVTPDLRTLLETSGVFVSYSVLREGTRMMGGQPIDPGYAKLRRLIDDATTAGVDRVNHATYQTVLGTAPPLAIVLDPQAREAEEVVDYVSDMNNSPNRDLLVSALLADDAVTRAELEAEFDKQRAEREEQGDRQQPKQPTGKPDPSAALVANLLALAAQSARIIKRLPKTVQLDLAQQANASVALDDLDVFTKRVRQIAAIRTVSVPAQRRAPRQKAQA
ncbi:hypothetical protein GCM10009555_014570 [Acrocarpospora macrocephala]|uniref:Uncharacterized protein n=1 Tax=Acrocarpospora macrocephala TaxID=150177 RepID=A0A5M3WH13_9ACTN|nr:hypothetical protein [Acrocarpospora macrocephala]GES08264.1 hypothetical protein Amac_018600 [Acrocarpospora macrocephala]